MQILRQKAELANPYQHWMEEFNNFKMEYGFIKAELLIYQQRRKKSRAKQWELHKEQVGEII
jgi:hypothetical protein